MIAALVAAAVSLLTFALTGRRQRVDRQRQLFGEAFASCAEYREFPYRVRRCPKDDAAGVADIVADLHRVQAKLDSYRAMLRVEDRRVGKAYGQLVLETRKVAGHQISTGWKERETGRLTVEALTANPAGAMDVRNVDLTSLTGVDESFLTVVADHLSAWPAWLRRLARWLRHPCSSRQT